MDAGLGMEATTHHQIGARALESVDGGTDRGRLVLAIAVHHDHQIACGIKNSLLDRAG